jgi:hypothetical protein
MVVQVAQSVQRKEDNFHRIPENGHVGLLIGNMRGRILARKGVPDMFYEGRSARWGLPNVLQSQYAAQFVGIQSARAVHILQELKAGTMLRGRWLRSPLL